MKNKYLLPILAMLTLLSSCGDNISTSDESTSESSSETITTTTDTNTETTSEDEVPPTEWSEEDKSEMVKFLGEGVTIPFVDGFTSKYVNASGTDEDGECFIVYDYHSGDLSSTYGSVLVNDGFAYYEGSDDEYKYYTKSVKDGQYILWVQLDYYQTAFEVFAWVEVAEKESEAFPYSEISSFLNVTLNESNFPSFALASGNKYSSTLSSDSLDKYILISGTIDTTIESATYLTSYTKSLEEKGFTVIGSEAFNATLKVRTSMVITSGVFYLSIYNYIEPTKGDYSLSLVSTDFPDVGKYGYDTTPTSLVKDSQLFKYGSVASSAGYVQFRNATKGGGEVYNMTSLGKITSIVLTPASDANMEYFGVLTLYVCASPCTTADEITEVSPVCDENNVFTYTVTGDYGYFWLTNLSSYASKIASIVINYTIK